MAADDLHPIVGERREAERRLDLRDAAADRRQGPRRDLDQRPADLRAAGVVIDLRDGEAGSPSSPTKSRSSPGAGSSSPSSGPST